MTRNIQTSEIFLGEAGRLRSPMHLFKMKRSAYVMKNKELVTEACGRILWTTCVSEFEVSLRYIMKYHAFLCVINKECAE